MLREGRGGPPRWPGPRPVPPPHSAAHQRGGEPGDASAHHHHIVRAAARPGARLGGGGGRGGGRQHAQQPGLRGPAAGTLLLPSLLLGAEQLPGRAAAGQRGRLHGARPGHC